MVALALAGSLALAGCTSTGPSVGPTGSASARSSALTPTTGKPTLSQLVVTPNGLGYLAPGAAVPSEPAAKAIVTYNPTKCVAAAEGITAGSPGAGAWLPVYPTGVTWAGSGIPFDVGAVAGPTSAIPLIEIWSPNLKTAKGIGAGSPVAQLTKAYGKALSVDRADNSDVYILPGARSELLFEVAKAAAGLPVEETGTVVWMRIVPLGTTQLHIANTDVSGPCDF
ncbi:MAG TPA: hypothetical protein VHZ98_01220 [Galbitalea sp.]|nr:hypothetical protein [Galbitalea sp.]